MSDFSRGMADLGEGIGMLFSEEHKRREQYREEEGTINALRGLITDKKTLQQIDQVLAQYGQYSREKSAESRGALNALNRVIAHGVLTEQSQRAEDASLSGQATRLRMQQSEQAFPLEQEARKVGTERTQQIIQQEKERGDKVYEPGFGWMKPTELSRHRAQQARLEILKQKADPIIKFENELQTKYGLRIGDIIDASKGEFDVGVPGTKKTEKRKGVRFVNWAGEQTTANPSDWKMQGHTPERPTVFAEVGSDRIRVPAHEWDQVLGKSVRFQNQLKGVQDEQAKVTSQLEQEQARRAKAIVQQKDPSQWTDEDRAVLAQANAVLGEE